MAFLLTQGVLMSMVVLLSGKAIMASGVRVPDEQRLYEQIMGDYMKTVRPVANDSSPLNVLFSIRLNQIVNLNERQQVLTTNVFIDQTWNDPALAWDPSEFQDVRSLRIPSDQVWKPDTFIYNNADNGSTGFIHGTYIQIRHTGDVTWPVPVRVRSSCVVKITYFPFDYQFCMVRFGSWIYSHSMVDYDVRKDVVSVDLSSYIKNSEWELLSMKLEKNMANRSRGLGLHPHLTAILYLKRNTFYYLFNIIVPCVMLSMLTLMTFWLPPTSGEKVTLGLSVFLAFSMFMLLIAEEVPASSDAVPLIGIYLCVVMTMTSLSVICAVLVTNLHNRGSKLKPAPRWVASLFIRYLAIPFCVNQDIQLLASTIYLSDYCTFFILQNNRCEKINANYNLNETDNSTSQSNLALLNYSCNKPVNCSQSFRQQQLKSSHQRHHSFPPPLSRHSNRNHTNKHQHVLEEKILEEEQTFELQDHSQKLQLLQKAKIHKSTQCTPYKYMNGKDENVMSRNCSNSCKMDETVMDLCSPSAYLPNLHTQPSSLNILPSGSSKNSSSMCHVASVAKESANILECFSKFENVLHNEHEDFNQKYSIAPCHTHESFCECGTNEEVWVLRDDCVPSSETDQNKLCRCLNHSKFEELAMQPVLPKEESVAQPEYLNSVKSPLSNKRIRRHYNQHTRRRAYSSQGNTRSVLKRAKVMIAEWCTIAKVVDRILFMLSLLATVFAYIFILVVVPAEHNAGFANVTFVNSLNNGQYRYQ